MGCQAGKFPFIYLGLPIGAKMKKLNDWAPVIDKFKKRLSDWKRRTVSYGGRLVLLKSVLSSLPLYYFSIYRAPPCVLNLLESVRRKFFWGGDSLDSKITWVKWDTTLLPYGEGGLNIGSLKGKNLALLGKWWWRFKTETDCLWTNVIRSIYGIDGGLRPEGELARLSASGIWNNIIFAGNQIDNLQISFSNSFMTSLGDGRSTSFWNDLWCSSDNLKNLFPRLYMLDSNKDVSVRGRVAVSDQAVVSTHPAAEQTTNTAPVLVHSVTNQAANTASVSATVLASAIATSSNPVAGLDASAAASFRSDSADNSMQFLWEWVRNPTGRTAAEFVKLVNLIKSISLNFNSPVTWKWVLAGNGCFTVKRLSQNIDSRMFDISNSSTQVTLRNNLVPNKLEIFVWRALRKRIPVRIELDKRGIDLHSVRYPVCDDGLESMEHCLVECNLSFDIWSRVYKWWNIDICSNLSFNDFLRGKTSQNVSPLGSKIWQAVEWVCVYYLWKIRNSVVFQNKRWNAPVALNEIQVKSYEWISCRLKEKKIDWQNWLVNPSPYLVC
ncbi:uncharacterized protein [Rutidosis leptorrhynchoides]|uniref:uncharacterized protein n=1 Tax=Rutidosis leptorrhynchoides TaxID=125765 RepID=UPI003A99519D